ncbi:MAG: LuxR family transcriptional regulator [Silicimonas sp.]|nr:LuxR family transcriptional regulator [Silicimonas sp.]NND20268.1 LuxR family transcriptional regulator [Silicimonas sp.]NND42311.1 LuxR family transcriptional regulator [Silicimonas sp.]NNL74218.1 LuxR family transcriptional regulator [Silicimonas sp.]
MLADFIEKLQNAETLDELNDFVVGLRDVLDVEHVIYHSVKSTGQQYAALTYTPQWVSRYLEMDYARIDPVVQSCYRRFHPVEWKQLDWSGKAARNFMGEAADSGVGNQGFSVPIRGPSGQFALFSVSGNASDDKWQSYTSERTADLILTSHYVNQKALELERGSDFLDAPGLSPRETDALTMLALGFNRAQAAEHLSISEHTLRVYIEGARFKLAASNTTHAVARALMSGLLVL